MKQNVGVPLLIGAIIVAVAVVVFIGYRSLADNGMTNIPPPGPIKQTENMAPGQRPMTMGSKGPKLSIKQ